MKGLGRKASFLAIVAVLATALFGSAYSLWFEELSATTNITTSSLDAQITCTDARDNELASWPVVGPFFQAYPKANPLKDVASASVLPQTPPFHSVELQISNAYPGYAWDCEVEVSNTAAVPWHLEDLKVTVLECDVDGENCAPVQPASGAWTTQCPVFSGICFWGNRGINPPTYPNGLENWSPLYVDVNNWKGCQIHEPYWLSGSLHIGVNQSAKQSTKYKLLIEYQVNQWNESGYTGVCGQLKPGSTGPAGSQLQ